MIRTDPEIRHLLERLRVAGTMSDVDALVDALEAALLALPADLPPPEAGWPQREAQIKEALRVEWRLKVEQGIHHDHLSDLAFLIAALEHERSVSEKLRTRCAPGAAPPQENT
jgi:hypothetical protein